MHVIELQYIDFATFGNKGCCVQLSGVLYKKKVYSHNFASKTRLIYFSHFPEIFI